MTAAIQTNCRIGKIRFKSGGELTVLKKPELGTIQTELLKQVRELVEDPRPMTGFALIAIRSDELTSTTLSAPDGFPMRCMPEFVAETIRRVMWND
jgi:hypothetical protein